MVDSTVHLLERIDKYTEGGDHNHSDAVENVDDTYDIDDYNHIITRMMRRMTVTMKRLTISMKVWKCP